MALGQTAAVARAATWQLPETIAREGVVALPGSVLLAGGMTASGGSSSAVWDLALQTGSVHDLVAGGVHSQPLPSLGIRVHDTAAALVNGVPLVFGGGNSSEVAAVQRVSPGTTGGGTGGGGTAAPASGPIGRLPAPNSDLVAITDTAGVLGSPKAVYVVGGYDGKRPLDTVLRTTDGHTFTVVAHLAAAVRYAAVALTRQGLWVIGGEANGRQLDAIQLLSPGAAKASVVAHLPTATGHGSAGVLRGLVVFAGGRTGSKANEQLTDVVLALDPATHRVRQVGRLPQARADAGAAVITTHSAGTSSDALVLFGGEAPRPDRQAVVITLQ